MDGINPSPTGGFCIWRTTFYQVSIDYIPILYHSIVTIVRMPCLDSCYKYDNVKSDR